MKRKGLTAAGAALVVAAIAAVVAVAASGANDAAPTAQAQGNTGTVQRGSLSSVVSLNGTLTHRARPDGSPYAVINHAGGTYTELPGDGDKIDCGGVLYRVDDEPVLLLCGAVPAYRDLRAGDAGTDVRALNANLHQLGYDAGAGVDPNGNAFTWKTKNALEKLQRDKGFAVTGALGLDDAVFLPDAVRIATVTGVLGGAALPGDPVARATSDTPEVQLDLDPSQQGVVEAGDRAQITLPGNRSVTGTIDRLGKVARTSVGPNGAPGAPTIPAYITLDDPAAARGLDKASVRVEITTTGVENVLSVPVTALVGKSGGGFAVEVVRAGERRELVAVVLGLFDTTSGRVQVEGALHEGDHVVVPSS